MFFLRTDVPTSEDFNLYDEDQEEDLSLPADHDLDDEMALAFARDLRSEDERQDLVDFFAMSDRRQPI